MWKVSVTNNGGGAEVTIGSDKWVLLNRGEGEGECRRGSGWFDLAVKKETKVTSINEGSVLTGAVDVVYCKSSTGELSFNVSDGKKWTDKYLFGWVRGDNAGVTFGVAKDKVLKNGNREIQDGKLKVNGGNGEKLLDDTFVQKMKEFSGQVKGLAGKLRTNNGNPIHWSGVYSKSGKEDEDITCNGVKANSNNWKCDWGIIDVSRYTGINSLFAL